LYAFGNRAVLDWAALMSDGKHAFFKMGLGRAVYRVAPSDANMLARQLQTQERNQLWMKGWKAWYDGVERSG